MSVAYHLWILDSFTTRPADVLDIRLPFTRRDLISANLLTCSVIADGQAGNKEYDDYNNYQCFFYCVFYHALLVCNTFRQYERRLRFSAKPCRR
jgi:hypothetical protein